MKIKTVTGTMKSNQKRFVLIDDDSNYLKIQQPQQLVLKSAAQTMSNLLATKTAF